MLSYAAMSKLIALLISLEGFSACAYWDVSQYSIGYGTRANSKYECIDKNAGKSRLINHLQGDIKFIKSVFSAKNSKPEETEIIGLASYCYNMGHNGCKKAVQLAANDEHRAASWVMRKEIKKGSGYEEGLTIRRAKETALLLEAAEKPSFTEWIISGYDY
jgi:GH24 family phage-related lysozyme (muramidase)